MKRHHTIARTFTALSHPRRVRIFETLQSLSKQRATFGELSRLTRIPAAPLAHHLEAMRAAGLVRRRDKGRYSEFSLQMTSFAQVVQAAMVVRSAHPTPLAPEKD